MARLAVGLAFTDDAVRIPQLSSDAVALARQAGDARALGAALAAHCDALAGPDHVSLRAAEATEIVDIGRSPATWGCRSSGSAARRRPLGVRLDGRGRCGRPRVAGWPAGSASPCTPGSPRWRGAVAHLAGDLETVRRCADEVTAYAGPADSRNAAVLGIVQRAWSRIERGETAETMVEIIAAFGEWFELAPDGGDLVALYHGQPHEVRLRALPHLRRLVEDLPKNKEWLPNLAAVTAGPARERHPG